MVLHLLAIRRSWSAIGSLFEDSIPRECRGRLLELPDLYRAPLGQQSSSGPSDITNPAPARAGSGGEDTQGGEGGGGAGACKGKRPMQDPPQETKAASS